MLNLVTLLSLGCLRQPVRMGRFNPMLNLVTLLSRVTLAVVSCYTPGTARGGIWSNAESRDIIVPRLYQVRATCCITAYRYYNVLED